MAIRFVKAVAYSLLSVAVLAMLVVAFIAWRLASGPVDVGFLNTHFENVLNQQFTQAKVSIQRTVLEMEDDSWIPKVKFINVGIANGDGAVIAQLPKVGVTLDQNWLVAADAQAKAIEISGAKINVTRTFDGNIELGIADPSTSDKDSTIDFNDVSQPGVKSDRGGVSGAAPEASNMGPQLISYLKDLIKTDAFKAFKEVKVIQARISLYDEANEAHWYSPNAEVIFKRDGNAIVGDLAAELTSAGKPWHSRITARYEIGNPQIVVKAEVNDLVPADVADKIFALSQMAKVSFPVNGDLDFVLDESGSLQSSKANFSFGQGQISFPDYMASPISIDQGNLSLNYVPAENTFNVVDSRLVISGSPVNLGGSLKPVRDEQGLLQSVAIDMSAKRADKPADAAEGGFVDSIAFQGRASTTEQRLEIDDLVVLSGETGVRLRGIVSGGDLSAGLQFAGRLRDVSSDLLKKLWPPILTPKTRAWINEHVKSGRISEGTFQVNLPPDALALALKTKTFQPGSIDLNFTMKDVTTGYFKALAPMTGAHGFATLKDQTFDLTLEGASVPLASGNSIAVNRGTFKADKLLTEPVTGDFEFDLSGTMQSLVDFVAQPDLSILNVDLKSMPQLEGNVDAKITLNFPMIKDVPKELVKFGTNLKLINMAKADIVPGVDLSGANLDVTVTDTDVTAQGTAKLNGIDSKINWSKPRKTGTGTTIIETTLDKQTQDRMGLKLDDYLSGSIPVKVTASGGFSGTAKVEADLSGAALKIDPLDWSRPVTDGTSLTFSIVNGEDGKRTLKDIEIKGKDLLIAGDVALGAKNNLVSANLSKVRLSDELSFAAVIKPDGNSTNLSITGDTFDARPYIKSAISPAGADDKLSRSGGSYTISARIGKVYANRGEIVQNVDAALTISGGRMRSAVINGSFLNGQAISFRVSPLDGGREMKVSSVDGGATLRAANFYSKVAGGELEFSAQVGDQRGSPINNGLLVLRNFEVRNEAALAELDKRGKPKKSGPRRDGMSFKRLQLPFQTDGRYVWLGNVTLKGNDMGAVARGSVRKTDGAMCITGTMIPAQGLTGWVNDVPLFGPLLSGGKGEGLIGVTFALGGTIAKPKYQVNPLSALAPGFLRKFFEFQLPKSRCDTQQTNEADSTGTVDSTY